jgi:hypothetical protein
VDRTRVDQRLGRDRGEALDEVVASDQRRRARVGGVGAVALPRAEEPGDVARGDRVGTDDAGSQRSSCSTSSP